MIYIIADKRYTDIDDAVQAIINEIDDSVDGEYGEYLDEAYGDVEIAGCTYSTSYALKELDPTAYRCGFCDWTDSLSEDIERDLNYQEDCIYGVDVEYEDDEDEDEDDDDDEEEDEEDG